jgi:uncharacterized membrane protein YccC
MVPDIAVGVRGAIATLLPFYFANASGIHELTWTALGGWFGTAADPGGSRATRLRVLLFFAVGGSACVVLSETCAPSNALAVIAITMAAFGGSLLRSLGGPMTRVGTYFALITAIGSVHVDARPALSALFFVAGAAWAAMLSTLVWPVWTHLPVRRALGALYAELAAYAADLSECIDQKRPHGDPRFSAIARRYRRSIREAIERARTMAVTVRARREGESRLGSNLRVLLGLAEAQFPLLITLSDDLEATDPAKRGAFAEVLLQIRHEATEVLRKLFTRVIASREEDSRATVPRMSSMPPPGHPMEQLVGRLSHTSKLAVALVFALDTPFEMLETSDQAYVHRPLRDTMQATESALTRLRETCSTKSPALLHALRVSGALCFAAIVGQHISMMYLQWVTLSTFVVLQPYAGATWQRVAQRVLGTVLGSIVAVVISMTVRSPVMLMLVMAPLSVGAVMMRPRNYRLFTLFVTPIFVLIATHTPGDWHVAAARTGATLTGGAIALIAALAIFPSWEHARLTEALVTMLKEVSRLARVVLEELGRQEHEATHREEVLACRRSTGIALSEAEASLERLLAEPTRKGLEDANAMQLVTLARRLAGALTALETYADASPRHTHADGVDQDISIVELVNYVDRVLASAERFATDGKQDPSHEGGPPAVPAAFDPHVCALIERVIAHVDLIAALAYQPAPRPASDRPSLLSRT